MFFLTIISFTDFSPETPLYMGNDNNFLPRFGLWPALACLLVGAGHAEERAQDWPQTNDESPRALTGMSATTSAIDPTEVYRDVYLLADDTLADLEYADESETLRGRRSFSTELVLYKNNSNIFGNQFEQGMRMRWRRETLGFGELEAEIAVSDIDRNLIVGQHGATEAMITLRQRGAAITNNWLMNSAIGHQRSLTGDRVGGGYRVRLPSSPLLGVSAEVRDSTRIAQWFTGQTGRVEGVALNQFKTDGGTLSGATFQREISPSLAVFGEVVNFSGNDLTSGHTSLLSAMRYVSEDQRNKYNVNLLIDDNSKLGLWSDAEHVFNSDVLMRYGAYVLGTDLAWMDRPIVNDEFGIYFRADKQSYSYNVSAGYDYVQSGLGASDPFGTRIHNLYFNGNFRVTQNLNLGSTGTLIIRQPDSAQNGEQLSWRLNNFAFYRSWVGTSRVELYFNRIDSGLPAGRREAQGLLVSHQWRMPQRLRLTTEFSLENGKTGSANTSQFEVNTLFRIDMGEQFSWGMNASAFRRRGNHQQSQDGVGVNADLRWAFLPNWYASAVLSRNTSRFDTGTDQLGTTLKNESNGHTFWLTVGYGKTRGQPIQILGEGKSAGAGHIQGEVFLDENGDFIRQPSEHPVIGAVVLLDGRYEARTDGLGRYTFEPVHTGPHTVSLEVSDLPLPWGLHDETPRVINVGLRHSGEANFAVTRLD